MSTHDCDSGDFDRTVCAEPCGMMHSYCTTCGARADACAHEHPASNPEPAQGATTSTNGGTGTVALDLDALRAVAEAATPAIDSLKNPFSPTSREQEGAIIAAAESLGPTLAELTRLREGLEALRDEWWEERFGSTLLHSNAAVRIMHLLAGGEGQPVCDHEGIEHGTLGAYVGVCPRCKICKFIGHGPLCGDCFTAGGEGQ